MSVRIDLLFAAPIPIGHRVRITWFRDQKRTLFGGAQERPAEPAVVDLDTGIEYVTSWMLEGASLKSSDAIYEVSATPRATVVVAQQVIGRVTACRIVTVRGSDYDVQTELVLAPEPESPFAP